MKNFIKRFLTTTNRSNLITPSFLYFMLPLIENTLYSYIIVGGFFFLIGKHLGSLEQLKQSSVNLWYFLAALGAIGIVYCLIEAWLLPPVSIEEPHPFVVLAHKITEAQIEELEKLLRFEYERKIASVCEERNKKLSTFNGWVTFDAIKRVVLGLVPYYIIPQAYRYDKIFTKFCLTMVPHFDISKDPWPQLAVLLDEGENGRDKFAFADRMRTAFQTSFRIHLVVNFLALVLYTEYTLLGDIMIMNNLLGLASYDFSYKTLIDITVTPNFYALACTLLSKQPSQVTIIFANAPEVTANSSIPLGYILVLSIMLFFISLIIVSWKRR